MIVRAICKHTGMPLLSVTPSMLLRMYVDETPRLVKALFSLVTKLQPCVLFLDEMDSLFRTRVSDDNSVDRNVKTECKKFDADAALSCCLEPPARW